MVPETVHCFVVLFFAERFPGRSFDVLISLFLSLCESLGISIMIVVLLLYGREWFEVWSKGAARLQRGGVLEAKYSGWCCVILYVEIYAEFGLLLEGGMPEISRLLLSFWRIVLLFRCAVDLLKEYVWIHGNKSMIRRMMRDLGIS
jgi:hypothetical protein